MPPLHFRPAEAPARSQDDGTQNGSESKRSHHPRRSIQPALLRMHWVRSFVPAIFGRHHSIRLTPRCQSAYLVDAPAVTPRKKMVYDSTVELIKLVENEISLALTFLATAEIAGSQDHKIQALG